VTLGQLIITVHASVVYVYISCTRLSGWLQVNFPIFWTRGLGCDRSEQKIWLSQWMTKGMGSSFIV